MLGIYTINIEENIIIVKLKFIKMTNKPVQLHQLLAIEAEKKSIAGNILKETHNTFTKKAHHFNGSVKIYEATEEGGDEIPTEKTEVVTTVKNKLDYTVKHLKSVFDVLISKEETNASGEARAELIVNNTNFGSFSATALLQMENLLKDLRKTYLVIPTLDPVKSWKPDPAVKGVSKSGEEIKMRTIARETPLVLYPATKEHPAQTKLTSISTQIGRYKTTFTSGMITPKQKADLLDNLDSLIIGVKKTRSIANNHPIKDIKIGNKFFTFIHGDIL